MRLRLFILCAVLPAASWAVNRTLEQRVVEHRLANGITLLVLQRDYAPTVSCRMMFRVGSVDEVNGKTGLAHMFEHMMFKGTKTLGTKNYAAEAAALKTVDDLHRQLDREKRKGLAADQAKIDALIEKTRSAEALAASFVTPNELWQLYEREGGSSLNASTSRDWTRYSVDLPSNKLALWAVLDSDRLKNPVFREFYSEREVVKEERRMRVDTQPDGELFERFLASAFIAHPYRMPTIGWESDLDHLNISDLEDFARRYYTPDQLTIVVVGSVRPPEVAALVEKHFGNWQAPPGDRSWITEEPAHKGPKSITVYADAEPRFIVGFPIRPWPDPDHVLSDALSNLLTSGMTSRLYESLVQKKKLASSVEVYTDFPGNRYPSQFIFYVTPRFPNTNAQVLKALQNELQRVKKEPIADWETEKVRSSVEMGVLSLLESNGGLADALVSAQTLYGDWRYILRYQEAVEKVTAADLQAAARRIFDDDKMTVAFLEKRR